MFELLRRCLACFKAFQDSMPRLQTYVSIASWRDFPQRLAYDNKKIPHWVGRLAYP